MTYRTACTLVQYMHQEFFLYSSANLMGTCHVIRYPALICFLALIRFLALIHFLAL